MDSLLKKKVFFLSQLFRQDVDSIQKKQNQIFFSMQKDIDKQKINKVREEIDKK